MQFRAFIWHAGQIATRSRPIGAAHTLAEAAELCREHARRTDGFKAIIDEDFCDEGGFDMAAEIGRDVMIYSAEAFQY